MTEHFGQRAVECPAVQTHVHRVPGTKVCRQAAPLAAIACHVSQCTEKALVADAHVATRQCVGEWNKWDFNLFAINYLGHLCT